MASTEFAARSSKGAGFLFFLGFGLAALGIGFAFAPQYSWQVTKIARQANELGLQNGVLLIGGLLTFALGFVARAAGGGATAVDPRPEIESLQSELHLHHEQLSTKIAQLRTSLMQVQDNLGSVAAQQQNQLQQEGEKPMGGDHSQEAVFRLAASLDKLHAHLDERVHAVDLQLRSGFETLLNASHDVRRHLEQGVFAAPSRATVQHAPQAGHSGHAPHAGHGVQPQVNPEVGIDFFETMQKLEAISGGDSGTPVNPPQGRHPQAPFPSHGNGESLDALLPEEYRDRY